MSEYTENLNLFKYDVIEDGKVPFSIEQALNANWDIIDNSLVKKSGDIMSGNLTISKSAANLYVTDTTTNSGYSGITLTHNGIDSTSVTAPTANINGQRISFYDKNNVNNGWLQYLHNTSNNIYSSWGVRRVVDGANKDCSINVGVSSDGTPFTYAPTPASTDNSTKIATTAFVKSVLSGSGNGLATFSKAANGYIKFNNGIICQWGRFSSSSTGQTGTVTFPTSFSGTNIGISMTHLRANPGQMCYPMLTKLTKTNFNWKADEGSTNYWVAIGY